MPMARVARALEIDETWGMMETVVDAKTNKIIGFSCLGVKGGKVTGVVREDGRRETHVVRICIEVGVVT